MEVSQYEAEDQTVESNRQIWSWNLIAIMCKLYANPNLNSWNLSFLTQSGDNTTSFIRLSWRLNDNIYKGYC